MTEKKVNTFDLNDPSDKEKYEYILNTYDVVKEEFDYMRDGTPKVTVWYIVSDD